jgi:hypothetical protein
VFDRRLIEGALPQSGRGDIAHYTRIGTLPYLLPDVSGSHLPTGWRSAWATPVQFLNDRKELSLGLEVLGDVAVRASGTGARIRSNISLLQASFGSLATDAFQMSFSGDPDELGQWRGYAANGMGCAIVTEVTAVAAVADVSGWIIYERAEQDAFAERVIGRLANVGNDGDLRRVLVAAASFMKHEGFSPEKEYRLLKFPDEGEVRFRESGDRLVPYVDYLAGKDPLPVNRILIGPGWQLAGLGSDDLARHHVVQGIDRLLAARRLHATNIESSRIPYDPK